MEILKFFIKTIAIILMICTGIWIFQKIGAKIILFIFGYCIFAFSAFVFFGYMALQIVLGIFG